MKYIFHSWLQSIECKSQIAIAIAGIAFADLSIFIHLGFQDALYNSATALHRNIHADLVVINPRFQSLTSVKSFQRDRLDRTLEFNGVKSVNSLYIATGQWHNLATRLDRAILVWGVDPTQQTFTFPEIEQQLESIKSPDRVLFDRASRLEYGNINRDYRAKSSFKVELNSKLITVEGIFANGASFAAGGNLIASNSTFFNSFPERKISNINIGLITSKPGINHQLIQQKIARSMPDLRVLTIDEFAALEKSYWDRGAIGFISILGIFVGFLVGIATIYQLLYIEFSDRLPEYTTLKAIGYAESYLFTIVLQKALILALLGFLPGIAVSIGLYQIARAVTLLPILMKVERVIFVLILTILMCVSSGSIAIRKLQSADADLF